MYIQTFCFLFTSVLCTYRHSAFFSRQCYVHTDILLSFHVSVMYIQTFCFLFTSVLCTYRHSAFFSHQCYVHRRRTSASRRQSVSVEHEEMWVATGLLSAHVATVRVLRCSGHNGSNRNCKALTGNKGH